MPALDCVQHLKRKEEQNARMMPAEPEPNPIRGVLITLAIETLWCVVVIGGWVWLRSNVLLLQGAR
jgi:hypothetical protein